MFRNCSSLASLNLVDSGGAGTPHGRMRFVLPILLLVLGWPLMASAQPFTADEQRQADALVEAALARSKVPSVSVAVVRGGELAYVKAYGQAELEPARAADTKARYDIGSVSKQFTATLLLKLVDEGRVGLDDPVGRYLPGVTAGDQITVRQLLSQISGYVNYWRVDFLPPSMRQDTAPQAIVDRWGHAPLAFEPGAQWQYSNTNYVLAGRIVEVVEGRPLGALLEERLFHPLGMTSARFGPPRPEGGDAAGYTRVLLGPNRRAEVVPQGWTFGAGGLSMTAEDLARWDLGMLRKRLLSPGGYGAQQAEARLTDGSGSGYGLGVYVGDVNGHRVISHDGASMGFLAQNRVYPDDGLAIVVLVNADYGGASNAVADGLQAMLLGPPPAPVTPAAAVPPRARPVHAETTELARRIFDDLAAGRLEEARFTPDGLSYFTARTRADLTASLTALGQPARFDLVTHGPWAGFDGSIHEIGWAERTLVLIMFRADDGRLEEYYLFSPD